MKRMILGALIVALWSGQAAAQVENFMTGNQLFSDCTRTDQHSLSFCLGYIIGIADALSEASWNGGSFRGFRSCSPGTALKAK